MLDLKLAIRFIFNLKKSTFSSYASWLTIIGLSIGVTALMLTISIIDGFKEEVSNKLASIEGQGRIKHFLSEPLLLEDSRLKVLFEDSNFRINPYVRGICMIRKGSKLDGILIEGVIRYPKIVINNHLESLDDNQIILGEPLALSLDANIGDTILLQSFPKSKLSLTSSKIFSFKVVHIFSSGLQEYDRNIVYMNLEKAQSLLGYKSSEVSGLIIDSNDNSSIDVPYPFYYETWEDRHSLLFEWMLAQQWPAYIMFGLITFVGLINLFAAIAMIIVEKNGPISILISQGMHHKNIKRIFMFQGLIIGLIGVFIGGLFSLIIINIQMKYSLFKIPSDIYFMDQIPFSFSTSKYFLIMVFVGSSSIIASWLPTNSFKSLNIAKALRYE